MNAIRISDSDLADSTFVVRCVDDNRWVVSTAGHTAGGIFRSLDDAWHFARAEARSHKHGEVVVLGEHSVDIEKFDGTRMVGACHVDDAAPETFGAGK